MNLLLKNTRAGLTLVLLAFLALSCPAGPGGPGATGGNDGTEDSKDGDTPKGYFGPTLSLKGVRVYDRPGEPNTTLNATLVSVNGGYLGSNFDAFFGNVEDGLFSADVGTPALLTPLAGYGPEVSAAGANAYFFPTWDLKLPGGAGGQIGYRDTEDRTVAPVMYFYVDSGTTMKGAFPPRSVYGGTLTYVWDLDLKKGWNTAIITGTGGTKTDSILYWGNGVPPDNYQLEILY